MDWLINKKTAFHIHTKYSHDSLSSPEDIVDLLVDSSFDSVIITDHNTIDGALRVKQYAEKKFPSFQVIIGEEISTDIGDLIAFPLNGKIDADKFMTVINKAKNMGAFICIPHPYEAHDLQRIHTSEFLDEIDYVEVTNSRISLEKNNYANQYADYYHKKKIVGTDAHILKELSNNFNFFTSIEINKYTIIKYSKKRDIRISQIITYYKKWDLPRILRYLFLYAINK